MNYRDWEQTVPEALTADKLWKMEVYRLALFAADLSWHDASRLVRDRRTTRLADQLYRAAGSIGANTADGYSRGTGRDRARFYEYALGSAREARHWCYAGRHVLDETVVSRRIDLLTKTIRLLLTIVPAQRGKTLKEPPSAYTAEGADLFTSIPLSDNDTRT